MHKLGEKSIAEYLVELYGEGNPIEMDCATFVQLLAALSAPSTESLEFGTGNFAAVLPKMLRCPFEVGYIIPSDKILAGASQMFLHGGQWLAGPYADGLYVGLSSDGPRRMSLDEWKQKSSRALANEVKSSTASHETGSSADIAARFVDCSVRAGRLGPSNWEYTAVHAPKDLQGDETEYGPLWTAW